MALPKISAAAKKKAETIPATKRLALVKKVWGGTSPSEVAGKVGLDFRSLLGWQKALEAEARHTIKSGEKTAGGIAKAYGVPVSLVEGWAKAKRKPRVAKRAGTKKAAGVVVIVLPPGRLTVAAVAKAVKKALGKTGRRGRPPKTS